MHLSPDLGPSDRMQSIYVLDPHCFRFTAATDASPLPKSPEPWNSKLSIFWNECFEVACAEEWNVERLLHYLSALLRDLYHIDLPPER